MAEPDPPPGVCPAVFRTLPLHQQAALLWTTGTLVACRWEGHQAVGLYEVGTFYCELYYDTSTYALLRTRPFTNRVE